MQLVYESMTVHRSIYTLIVDQNIILIYCLYRTYIHDTKTISFNVFLITSLEGAGFETKCDDELVFMRVQATG